ncbi:AtzE family amidohydrolase (plasmid) [Paroceanicella profunda]|uniref:AtzE family amidohydrolase n=2 Tax=Paroceanicella profunda TaxID=2579971 RepID=A0A5B8G4B3_9RHOB|nr:AtzE family amidohydrolase [Paroceanicella profunda]QDL94299.1 AtzE family amidohydrolase [Paroceanicella profunda]
MAVGIASDVGAGRCSAAEVTSAALARIAAANPALNAFTAVTAERARARAAALDAALARGEAPGPLAGVPFAVKNLLDIEGLPTLAGAKINRDRPQARRDAVLIRRLEAAGAVLVGAVGMGEYAYDFTGENAHFGACRNPHDPGRMTGGSSSGSAAATAAGLAPVSLGSDTNGSLRVPASLCGVFSLKPTYGRLSRTGSFSFVDSLDHLGPFARSVTDLALAYDALQGPPEGDHACAPRAPEPALPGLDHALGPLRVGLPGGWFARHCGTEGAAAATRVAAALGGLGARCRQVDLDAAEAGRAAAYLITNSESSAFHLERLRARAGEFDPDTRDRFLAGALLPAAWVARAQRVRAWWLARALAVFATVDALIVPATPVSAPLRGETVLPLGGQSLPLRPSLGLLSQPFSCIGLPVVTVPVFRPGEMPIGVQIIAPPWHERRALRIARALERAGHATAHPPVRRDMRVPQAQEPA